MHRGAFPSGQRGQTVNLLSTTSVVRIHPLPPKTVIPPGIAVFSCPAAGGFESRLLAGRRWRAATGVAFPQKSESTRSPPPPGGGGGIPAAAGTCAGGTCSAEARRLCRREGSPTGAARAVPPGTAGFLVGAGNARPRRPGDRPGRDRPGLPSGGPVPGGFDRTYVLTCPYDTTANLKSQ